MRAVVATTRPRLQHFFAGDGQSSGALLITAVPLESKAVAEAAEASDSNDVTAATVVVVDASLDIDAALEVCEQLRLERPSLPLCALFCCQHSLSAARVQALMALGVHSFLDLQLTADETLRGLRAVARGESVFRLQLTEESSALLAEVVVGKEEGSSLSPKQIRLIELVAGGLTDQEIGRQMHLSPHTIKHHIEQLRTRLEVRNRVQLAAWAGSQGLAVLSPPGRRGTRAPA